MATVLLYNFRDPARRMGVKLCLHRLGLRCRDVAPEEQGQPLGRLLGLEGFGDGGGSAAPFSEEMLVMHGLAPAQFNALLGGIVRIGEGGVTEDDILVHDPYADNLGLQMMLADMKYPDYPVALGVIRDVAEPTYDEAVAAQCASVSAKARFHSVDELLASGATWQVKYNENQ